MDSSIWYRASKDNNIQNVFSGDGGLFTTARWNHLGKKVIYCSQSISLCTLEWLAYQALTISSGFTYHRYSIEIPNSLINRISIEDLPKDWNKTPATDSSRDFAEQYLFTSGKFLALAIPSVIVPEEFNLVINPLHEKFFKIIKTIKDLDAHTAPKRD